MKKIIIATLAVFFLAATPALAQMMGGGPHMMQEQFYSGQHENPYRGHSGMMPGFGPPGMGPGMMGHHGYGMGPGMMMGGYGMGPGMMMRGYGMHPGMMGGYGMGPGMMGGYGMFPPCGGHFWSDKGHTQFLDDTREIRKKIHILMFDYGELRRSPEPDMKKLQEIEKEIYELQKEVYSHKVKKQ